MIYDFSILLEKVSKLPVAKPQEVKSGSEHNKVSVDDRGIAKIASILNEAKSPLVIVGTGALKQGTGEAVRRFIMMAQIPVASFLEAFAEALVAKQPYVLVVPVSYDTNWID